MKQNLINVLKNAFNDKVLDTLATKTGVDQSSAKSGVEALIPTVLGSLLDKNVVKGNNEPTWWKGIADFFSSDKDDVYTSQLENPLFEKTNASLISNLFGSNESLVKNAIGKAMGGATGKTNSFVNSTVPLIIGYLSNWLRRNKWSFGNLISNLTENKSSLLAALPAGISPSMFGLTSGTPYQSKATESTTRSTTPEPEPRRKRRPILWIILLLLLALLLWWLLGKGCKRSATDDSVTTQDTETVEDITLIDGDELVPEIKGSLNEAGEWVYDLGQEVTLKLKDGKELLVGENSVENRLVRFIESDDPVDKTTWFSLDRLFFETGKNTLKPESQEQLQNIVNIMEAYPDINIKLGGYTDNTGSDETNNKLSQERAEVAMQELINLGADAARLEAEGYGPQHPIASNDTPEGRAQNRRIDVRVTQK